jgi:hypothetical protein
VKFNAKAEFAFCVVGCRCFLVLAAAADVVGETVFGFKHTFAYIETQKLN